jgi:hypothetical protein
MCPGDCASRTTTLRTLVGHNPSGNGTVTRLTGGCYLPYLPAGGTVAVAALCTFSEADADQSRVSHIPDHVCTPLGLHDHSG